MIHKKASTLSNHSHPHLFSVPDNHKKNIQYQIMNQNYNSSTSEQYSLHVSNEHTEMSLPPNALSSANNFEVNLSPALDLNQLSFLQSTDVEVRIRKTPV